MLFSRLVTALMAIGVERAAAAAIQAEAPAIGLVERSHVSSMNMVAKRTLDCGGNIPHLSKSDCQRLAHLGFAQHGVNADKNVGSDSIWVGSDGKWKAAFKNTSGKDVILVVWNQQFQYASSFVVNNQPRLTVSVAAGQEVTVSFAEGSNGAWSGIYPETQMDNGQIGNTWGEFSTGQYATVDVSREVNMSGTAMSMTTPGGCTSSINECVFVCKSGNKCGSANTYTLQDCTGPQAAPGGDAGGCQGWSNGGLLHVQLEK